MAINSERGGGQPTTARSQPFFIRVLIGKQGDQWLAQGLEKDIAAQAPSFEAVKASFVRMLQLRMRRDVELGREPFEGLSTAPVRFFEIWERLAENEFKARSTRSVEDMPPVYVIEALTENLAA